MKKPINIDQAKSLLTYDPISGNFMWKKRKSTQIRSDLIAGCINSNGYVCISFKGTQYLAHRVAWEFQNGPIPDGLYIDHINGVRSDNRIVNLRLAEPRQNSQNKFSAQSNCAAKLRGVSTLKSGKFMAAIYKNRKKIYLGLFDTAEEAHAEYIKAKRSIHEFCSI